MSQENYSTDIIDLQDKDLIIDSIITKDNVKTFKVIKPKEKSNKCCKHCGSLSIKIQGYHVRKIKYLDVGSFKSNIEYKQRRFICDDCHKTFNEDTTLVEKGSTISNQTKVKLLERLRTKSSFTDLSEELNISVTTAIKEFYDHIAEYRCKLTEVICIDEFRASTIAGEYALIIGDPVSGKILDILPSRKQDYIYYYFQTIPDEERANVKYVVTDLFESYRTIVKTLLWKSIHIADRFHWIRLATEAFNNIRIRIMNSYLKLGKEQFKGSYNKYTMYANVLKKYHKIFLANRHAKEQWYFDQKVIASYIKKEMTLNDIIEYCINLDEDLSVSYLFLQDLYEIAKISSFESARKDILAWCDKVEKSDHKIPELVRVTLTYKSWIMQISNSFIINPETKARMTNGFIEGKNNFCKVIKRIGFGYSNFDLFRARILYSNDVDRPYKN